MARKVVTIDEVREYAKETGIVFGDDVKKMGIMALVDVEDMGYCDDGITRWYHFDMNGVPCVYFKH